MRSLNLLLALFSLAATITATTSCCGQVQPIFISLRSLNSTFNNKATTSCSKNLCVILMGNTGINPSLTPEFGWDTGMGSEGTLSIKSYISDGKSINPGDLKFEWLPLQFQFDIYSNLAMTVFEQRGPNNGPTNDKPRLKSTADGALVMAVPGAADLDRWYVCGQKLVWGLGRAPPDDLTCVKVSLVKVSKP